MIDNFTSVIDRLERQKAAIERALAALREVDAPAATTQAEAVATQPAPARKRSKFSAAARRKMALAQKARWAKIKGELEQPPAAQPPKPRRRISEEGMKRIIAATKKRWRLRRKAAREAQAKKVAPKKVAAKKAIGKAAVKKAAPAPVPPSALAQAAG